MKRLLLFAVLPLVLAACSSLPASPDLALKPVAFTDLNGWSAETSQALLPLMRRQCRRLAQLPPETSLGGSASLPTGRRVGDWSGACEALMTAGDARLYFERWFQPYQLDHDAFYTGYYEPQLQASLRRGGAYQVPLYARPADLVRAKATDGRSVNGHWVGGVFRPYDTRAQIDAGSLEGKGLEIAWLKDPVDLFVLQVQGSGRLILPNGRVLRVGYDGQNGQPYVPIGRVMVKEGDLSADSVSMDAIRVFLDAHPERARAILERNPSYVFFRRVQSVAGEGPKGAFGVPLTAGRSVAIDRTIVPFAMPVWVETRLPDPQGRIGAWCHLTFAQDIGTDIKGPGRADLFTGWGDFARSLAGGLRTHGRMVLFLPRPATAEGR